LSRVTVPEHDKTQPWIQPGWFDTAGEWIREQLTNRRIAVTGAIEQRNVRPWSTVLRVPTNIDDIDFKATSAAFQHEPDLTLALGLWRPDCIPEVLAIEPERGWLLMHSSGAMLRTLINNTEQSERHWTRVLPLYAELQIDLVQRQDELLALRAPDYRPLALSAAFGQLLSDTKTLRIGRPDGLSLDEHQQLSALIPRLTQLCGLVQAASIPLTLHHDDFHDANVFYQDGRYTVTDWAESGVSHPFCTLVVALHVIAYRAGAERDAALILRIRDSYLEPWQRFAAHSELVEIAALARPLGAVARALTWRRATADLPGSERDEYAEAVPRWLRKFLAMMD
jgi:hypothetical protein